MLIQFRIGQQIAGFGRLFHIAAHKFAPATATSPNPAAVGEGQTFAQRGMQQRLVRANTDFLAIDDGGLGFGLGADEAHGFSPVWKRPK
jgi:hypothetical protein